MNRRYVAVLPKSDELKHYGIAGQAWGRRRFQYQNGLLTPAGRERYGYGPPRDKSRAGAAAKAVGRGIAGAAKKATKVVTTAIKRRHPSLMSDQELAEFTKRVNMERTYKDAVRDLNSRKLSRRALGFTADLLKKGAYKYVDQFSTNLATETAKKLAKTKSQRLADEMKAQKEIMLNREQFYEKAKGSEQKKKDYEKYLRDRDKQNKVDREREKLEREAVKAAKQQLRDSAREERRNANRNGESSESDDTSQDTSRRSDVGKDLREYNAEQERLKAQRERDEYMARISDAAKKRRETYDKAIDENKRRVTKKELEKYYKELERHGGYGY